MTPVEENMLSVPREATKAPRRGPGRVAADGATDLVQLTVRVPKKLADKLRRLGGGNASLGLRRFAATLDHEERADSSDERMREDESARRGFL
jgi:hypothetical protein